MVKLSQQACQALCCHFALCLAVHAGSDVRLELVTQGTLFVQETLLPKRRAPRLHLMFQVTGPTKTGVVSVVAKKAFGSKYAFKTLMVELPDKTATSRAAAAAGTAAMMKAEAAKAANTTTTTSSSSSSVSQSSSSQEGSGADTAAAVSPARIYIIGAPAGSTTNSSSSSSNPRHMSPTSLLEDLKDPLLYALKVSLLKSYLQGTVFQLLHGPLLWAVACIGWGQRSVYLTSNMHTPTGLHVMTPPARQREPLIGKCV
jgi:hypothetical protein